MKICQRCFNDEELKAIVNAKKIKGTCDICHHDDYIYDTALDDTLVNILDDFLNIYKKAPNDVTSDKKYNLEKELIDKWHLFSASCNQKIKEIITAIYSYSNDTCDKFDINLFDDDVYIPQMVDSEYLKGHSILRNYQWADFVSEIKYKNRFHSDIINKEQLENFLEPLKCTIPKGSKFFRARISGNNALSRKDLGMPTSEKARPGRIGAEGIPCFYLANDIDTAIKEVRSGAYDYVTVAMFKAKVEIKAIDFRLMDKISPFSVSDAVDLAINKEHLMKIKNEVEKPIRTNEKYIEYVPIQYICDFIRSKKYDGIIYKSTLNPNGYNLAAFSDVSFQCRKRQLFYITNMRLEKEEKEVF